MIQEEVIETAITGWTSNIVSATKKNGSLTCFVDYRKLNVVTVRDYYLLPMGEECIASVEEARILQILDANSGYRQIECDEHIR